MGFEVFDKRMTPMAKAPSVTIQKRGVISLNKAAHQLIDSAQTVELLFDPDRRVVALRPADDSSPHAYAVRNGSKRGRGAGHRLGHCLHPALQHRHRLHQAVETVHRGRDAVH